MEATWRLETSHQIQAPKFSSAGTRDLGNGLGCRALGNSGQQALPLCPCATCAGTAASPPLGRSHVQGFHASRLHVLDPGESAWGYLGNNDSQTIDLAIPNWPKRLKQILLKPL